MASVFDPRSLLGSSPTAEPLRAYLKQLADSTPSKEVPSPEIKSYSDALYKNYYPLGLSLMFIDKESSKSIKGVDSNSESLVLDSIDIYNSMQGQEEEDSQVSEASSTSAKEYATYPAKLILPLLPGTVNDNSRPTELTIEPSLTGKDLLLALGEPDRKGGGTGPSSGSINIYCEWSKDGIMIEFGGSDARGPHAWERGKDAEWRVLTLFRPKVSS